VRSPASRAAWRRTAGRGCDRHRPQLDLPAAGRFAAIVKALPAVRFVDFSGVIAGLRLVKSVEEVGVMRRAAAIADQAMVEAIGALGHGGTDRAASAAASAAIIPARRRQRQGRLDRGRPRLGLACIRI
jgi:Xaa-Pro aminopeptidase